MATVFQSGNRKADIEVDVDARHVILRLYLNDKYSGHSLLRYDAEGTIGGTTKRDAHRIACNDALDWVYGTDGENGNG